MKSKFVAETYNDRLLRYHKSELRKEPSNLKRDDAKRQTVIKRIIDKLVCASADIYKMNLGDVNRHNAEAFEMYLSHKIYPLLADDEMARQYIGWDTLITHLKKLSTRYERMEGASA